MMYLCMNIEHTIAKEIKKEHPEWDLDWLIEHTCAVDKYREICFRSTSTFHLPFIK